jgi:hypothetical protein
MMRYKVIKEYSDAPQDPIRIKEGETLEFIEESDPEGDWPNWVFCRGKEKEGWIPRQILRIEETLAVSLADYSAQEHNLYPEEILVSEKILNGWIWCYKQKEEGRFAWAPLNHLIEWNEE